MSEAHPIKQTDKGISTERADELTKRFAGTSVEIAYDKEALELTLSLPAG